MKRSLIKIASAKLLLIAFLFIEIIIPQNKKAKFERFTTKDGISQSFITAIAQDAKGYIWFTTQNGLNKFDGYDFTIYRYDPKDVNSPSGNWMNHIFTDSFGKIWIKVAAGGYDCFDPNTEEFMHFEHDSLDPGSLSSNFLNNPVEDYLGNIWLITNTRIVNKFNRDSKTFTHFPNDSLLAFPSNVISVYPDPIEKNVVWLSAIREGISKFNLQTNEITKYRWRDHKVSEKIYQFIKLKNEKEKPLASILKVGEDKKEKLSFEIIRETKALVSVVGEGLPQQNLDYGWIKKDNKLIWKSDAEKSAYAGGQLRSRTQFEILTLTPGKYTVYFRSDVGHSFDKWATLPPDYPEFWGIQILGLEENEAQELEREIKKSNSANSVNVPTVSASFRIENELWLATWGGRLNRLSLETGQFEHYKVENLSSQNNSINFIRTIKGDKKGRLWITDREHRLHCFDSKSKNFLEIPGKGLFLNIAPIITWVEDKFGNIWVATQSKGLFKIATDEDNKLQVTNYIHDRLDPNSISDNFIASLMADSSGNVWIGTGGGGLNKINEKKQKFGMLTYNPDTNNALSSPKVSAIVEDVDGTILIGTKGGGINRFHPDNGIIERLTLPAKGRKFNSITSLLVDSQGNLLISPSNGGLFKLGKSKTKLEKVSAGKYSNILNQVDIKDMLEDIEGNLWLALNDSGVIKINFEKNQFNRYAADPNKPNALQSGDTWTVYEDKKGNIWVGTALGGFSLYNSETDDFRTFTQVDNDPYGFRNRSVECLYEDSKGRLWVGSFSAGLNHFEKETGRFYYYTVKDGLAGNRIDGILEDDEGNLWLSTNNGLSKFNPQTKEFKNFDYLDGLQANEFNRGVYLKASDSRMYFGGDHGLNYFHPDEIKTNQYIPRINITSFKKQNKEVRFEKSIEDIDLIELSYNEDQVSFEFISLDYTNPSKNQYAYKMKGVDKDWLYSGTRRFASYTNLDPGKYTFSVKGTNSDGFWNEHGASVDIIVHPPFWATWWFYSIVGFMIISTVIVTHQNIVRKKIKQTLEYERIRNNERDKVREELSRDFHDELGHKLTRISMFVRGLQKRVNGNSNELASQLNKVSDTSQSLYLGAKDLIWALNPEEDTLYDVLIRLKDFGDDLFGTTEVKFSTKGIAKRLKVVNLPMEWKRHLVLIFKESMNNILKYADCEHAVLEVSFERDKVSLTLTDDGRGFEISSNGSSGYGLTNIRKRAEKINGRIEIESEVGSGTKIVFTSNIPHLSDC